MLLRVKVRADGRLDKDGTIVNDGEAIPMSDEEKDYFKNVTFMFTDGEIQKISKTKREVIYSQKVTEGPWNIGHDYAHNVIEFQDMDLRGKVFKTCDGKVPRNRISFEGASVRTPQPKEGREAYTWEACKKGSTMKLVVEEVLEGYIVAMRRRDKEILNLIVNQTEDEDKIIAILTKII